MAHLHQNTKGIRESEQITSYLDTITKQAPPLCIHRPTIDASLALTYARSIASRPSMSLKLLQAKLVFLLAMSAFLRPSDLARIPFDSCSISDDGRFLFHVVAPKETWGKLRCFTALRDHPGLTSRPPGSTLFVKSNNVHLPLSAATLSSWLHRDFIALCTSEPGVTIWSLASSRALDLGVPMDHIVTLGNWASSATFTNHYRRNQMAQVDFTSTILSDSHDQFFDATDEFSLD
ncbi:hypothetical protein BX666DRAFT_1868151 [Dichotomocladium elegans]|nr:hypothetical protein BX666DRAFT_1868151 [Dichotomocladium elegans]